MKGLKEILRSEPNFEDYDIRTQIPYKEGFSPKLDKNLEKNIVQIQYGGKPK